jgi:hypothetical protein
LDSSRDALPGRDSRQCHRAQEQEGCHGSANLGTGVHWLSLLKPVTHLYRVLVSNAAAWLAAVVVAVLVNGMAVIYMHVFEVQDFLVMGKEVAPSMAWNPS